MAGKKRPPAALQIAIPSGMDPGEIEEVLLRLRRMELTAELFEGEEGRVLEIGGEPEKLEEAAAALGIAAWTGDNPSRRRVLDLMLAGVVSLCFLGVAKVLLDYSVVPGERLCRRNSMVAGKANELEENTAKYVLFYREPVVIIRSGKGYHALSAICTHMNICRVKWDRERRELACPCHSSAFDVFGNVLRGPAPRPLKSYNVEIVGSEIVVST